MMVFAMLLAFGLLLELGLHLPGYPWRVHKFLAASSLLVTALASGMVVGWRFNLWSVLILLLTCYRIFNCLRIVVGRMHERYLNSVTLRTSLVFIGLQLVVAGLWVLWDRWHQTG